MYLADKCYFPDRILAAGQCSRNLGLPSGKTSKKFPRAGSVNVLFGGLYRGRLYRRWRLKPKRAQIQRSHFNLRIRFRKKSERWCFLFRSQVNFSRPFYVLWTDPYILPPRRLQEVVVTYEPVQLGWL